MRVLLDTYIIVRLTEQGPDAFSTKTHAVYECRDGPALEHKEPFDPMLIATMALAEDAALVSVDRQFPKYPGLRVIS